MISQLLDNLSIFDALIDSLGLLNDNDNNIFKVILEQMEQWIIKPTVIQIFEIISFLKLNIVIFVFLTLSIIVCCFIIIFKPLLNEIILVIFSLVIFITAKIVLYTTTFDTIFYYLGDIEKSKVIKFTFFDYYTSWIMFAEIAIVAFPIDILVIKKLSEKSEKPDKLSKIDIKIDYEDIDKNPSEIQVDPKYYFNHTPKRFNINFCYVYKRHKKSFPKGKLMIIFSILRILTNITFGYIFYNFNKPLIPINNKLAVVLIYGDLSSFIFIPSIIYIGLIIKNEISGIKSIIVGLFAVFINILCLIPYFFVYIGQLINRLFKYTV